MIGKTINNYLIERKLGDGAMGEVFYAKHNKVDREVAIKVLHSHLFSNESIHNRFKNEANALIKLNHPNIVKIFDYVEQENFACLIMEYINGYTLDVYISKFSGPLPSAKASSIISSVLDAVQYAHNSNVYHRDIKPANIMISPDGNKVRIMDFGIAKLTDSKNFKTTHANTQLGTPFYMSPEQIKGLPYSRMSDIYSLGVTLFEMVTGKCPYQKITSLFELQSKIVNEPLPPTNKFIPGVSFRIQNAIIRATQKNPEFRFQNCDDFKKYLQENDSTIIPIPPPKSAIQIQPKNGSNWVTYIIAGIAFITIIVIVSLYLTEKTEPETQVTKIILPVDSITTKTDSGLLKFTDSPKIFSPEQNLIALDSYFKTKKETTKIDLDSSQKNKIISDVKLFTHQMSKEDFCSRYDKFFVKKPPTIKFPGRNQITRDFREAIKNYINTIPCKIPLDNEKQIMNINIPQIPKNPDKEIFIDVSFEIYEDGNSSDPDPCSIRLKYVKKGYEYFYKESFLN